MIQQKIQQTRRRFTLTATFALLFGALTFGTAAHALQAIQDIADSPVPAGLSTTQVKKAMIRAGARRNWIVRESGAGALEATLHNRKHMVKVDIQYNRKSYSITYKASANMKYKGGLIHKKYNAWVRNLDQDIQRELLLSE
ncbi:MAG: hypothetical protein AB8B93_10540 [Pseudomonadales bacterium]